MDDSKMEIDETSIDEIPKWRGHSMHEIYYGLSPWDQKHFPDVTHSSNHTVLYHLPLKHPPSLPKPHKGLSRWDSAHVRLPYSPKNQYPVINADGTDDIKERWELITQALSKSIKTCKELENAIFSYNTKYSKTWKFKGLYKLFEEVLDEDESKKFFKEILPGIIDLAVRLPDIVPLAIPLLKKGDNKSISFSQEQIASLLANAFLCTYPRRNTQKRFSEYGSFPDINFNRLFQADEPQVIEKLKCICNYFRRVCKKVPLGVVTIIRRSKDDHEIPNWNNSSKDFSSMLLHISSNGTIEDQGVGLLQVDFANKFLGGGVLGRGCVQEEIRFVICPEMFISKLITESLGPNEVLFMIGCERYNGYEGYASRFKWDSNYEDDTPWDESRRKKCCIVAIDALNFYKSSDQYKALLMLRDLTKAHVGYLHEIRDPAPGVATGNWGCGAFGGDKRLKGLLQLIVCCQNRRPLVYYTFGDEEFRDDFMEMFQYLVKERITIAELWGYIKCFGKEKLPPEQLYPFIHQCHLDTKQKIKSTILPQQSSSKANTTQQSIWSWPSLQKPTNTTNSFIKSSVFYNKPEDSSEDEVNPIVQNLKQSAEIEHKLKESKSSEKKPSALELLDQSYSQLNQTIVDDTQLVVEPILRGNTLLNYYARINNANAATTVTQTNLTEIKSEEMKVIGDKDIETGDISNIPENNTKPNVLENKHSDDEDVIPQSPNVQYKKKRSTIRNKIT